MGKTESKKERKKEGNKQTGVGENVNLYLT